MVRSRQRILCWVENSFKEIAAGTEEMEERSAVAMIGQGADVIILDPRVWSNKRK